MGWFSRKKDLDFCENYNASEEAEDFYAEAQKNAKVTAPKAPKHALTVTEVETGESSTSIPMAGEASMSPIDALRARVLKQAETEAKKEQERILKEKEEEERRLAEEKAKEKARKTTNLLEKCSPFILDGGGSADIKAEPTYILESIDSILGAKKTKKLETEVPAVKTELKKEPEKTVVSEMPKKTVPTVQSETIVMERADFAKIPVLSDIDNAPATQEDSKDSEDIFSTTQFTQRFDIASDSGKSTMTFTRVTDLKSSIAETDNSQNEEKILADIFGTDPKKDKFVPDDEYSSVADAKRIGVKLKKDKRSNFYASIISVLGLILSGIFCIPSVEIALAATPNLFIGLQFAFLTLCLIANWKMFYHAFKGLLSKTITPDLATIITLIVGVISACLSLNSQATFGYTILLCCFILASRSILYFKKASYIVNNFRIIANSKKKNAVTLIGDRPTTFAMARNSIEGDVLVTAAKETKNVTDYMKNATAPMQFEGGFFILAIIFAAAAILGGLSVGMSQTAESGMLTAFIIMSLLVAPTALACDIVPLCSASKKLNRLGAMISGKKAINRIDSANACVLHSTDFFPRGTVTLHSLQVLSDNSIDETLLDAAAITSHLNSPLAHIFADIAATDLSKELPEADSVKYENQLGITGWVKDRHLFIGNRTLLEAHGIKLPSLEVDKKIMRQGFFPVYVASGQKACALLVIKYNVSERVAKELSKLCSIGVTILVNNCDSNISEQMLCDYFSLDPDCIRIMTDSGIHMYKTQVNYTKSSSAPAVFLKRSAVLPSIILTAIKTKKSISLLRVLHIVAASLAVLATVSLGVTGSEISVNGFYAIIFETALLILSSILNLFYK
ncbi:MAG: hypothetical protein E7548_01115 [Ruminococcaceae bacterium]|nr:hypothetical protein [Oscillospiraceae bacterium]